jgi:NAD(P)-dependent dehydrogenase (short-subunit alcohol dehydrogenase family)
VNEPIDVLVNNAGIYTGAREAIWATNLRGPILLTRALESRLARDARIVNVTSGLGALSSQSTALRRKLDDNSLTIDALLALPAGGYGESKAALNAYTRLLAAAWPERVVASVDPGWVRTEMGGAGAPRSIEQGAASLLFCARLPPGGPTGKVWRDGREIGP